MDDPITVELAPDPFLAALFRLVWMILTLWVWWRFCLMLERSAPIAWAQVALALCAVVGLLVVGRIALERAEPSTARNADFESVCAGDLYRGHVPTIAPAFHDTCADVNEKGE
jgi:hypothetical protein